MDMIMTNLPSLQDVCAQIINLSERPPAMLQHHLGEFYGVASEAIGRAVTRNPSRFPDDFAFRLTDTEMGEQRCQNGISKSSRYAILAFTEAGALALSGVLKSPRAAEVSVMVHRGFVALRKRQFDQKDSQIVCFQHHYLNKRPLARKVLDLVERGCDFAAICVLQKHQSRRTLSQVLDELFTLRFIQALPPGTPDAPAININGPRPQLSLFAPEA